MRQSHRLEDWLSAIVFLRV